MTEHGTDCIHGTAGARAAACAHSGVRRLLGHPLFVRLSPATAGEGAAMASWPQLQAQGEKRRGWTWLARRYCGEPVHNPGAAEHMGLLTAHAGSPSFQVIYIQKVGAQTIQFSFSGWTDFTSTMPFHIKKNTSGFPPLPPQHVAHALLIRLSRDSTQWAAQMQDCFTSEGWKLNTPNRKDAVGVTLHRFSLPENKLLSAWKPGRVSPY